MLTAKGAIKGRCADCYGRTCKDTDCALFGLSKPRQGANRTAAIRNYCRWCMAGENIKLCSCIDCPIRVYRAQEGGRLYVDFLPLKGTIGAVLAHSNAKTVSNYIRGENTPQNAVIHGKEGL